jgi:hypothetical protein
MKLTLEHYKNKYTVETEHDDVTIDEQLDIFIGLLQQAGYHKEIIEESITELAESFKK